MSTATASPTSVTAPVVWVVEDSPEDFAVVQRALTRSGPLNGLEHFERAEAAVESLHAAGQRPDLLVVDLNLPGIDGVEFIRRVRASPDERVRSIPICMLTSSTRASDRERSTSAGADAYLVKPRRSSELQSLAANVRALVQPQQ